MDEVGLFGCYEKIICTTFKKRLVAFPLTPKYMTLNDFELFVTYLL